MNLKDILEVAQVSDTGQVREHNEDSTGADLGIGTVILADGMGGYRGGEVASAIAVTQIMRHLQGSLDGMVHGKTDDDTGFAYESLEVKDAIVEANLLIRDLAMTESEVHGMGTTVAAAVFYDNRVTVAHVGDSRVYRLRHSDLEQLTEDHTLVQELVERGFFSKEEAGESVNKNLVTRALGVLDELEVDLYEEAVLPGDIYLLCSDGLNDMVSDDEIFDTLVAGEDDLQSAAQALVDLANEHGGQDNVSVILVRPTEAFPAPASAASRLVDVFSS